MQQALKEGMAAFRAAEAEGAVVQPQPGKPSIASHRAFAPMLAVWGAALGGLSVAVLPRAMIMQAAMFTGLAGLGGFIRPALATIAAVSLGWLAFAIATLIRRKATGNAAKDPVAEMLAEKVRPIDPVSELGSESLDAPIEATPDAERAGHDEFELSAQNDDDGSHHHLCDPREMGLEEFGALPGRDAVWVADGEAAEDPEGAEYAQSAEHRPESDAAVEPEPTLSAIEKLRSVPLGELSLVQMVERFAAALHERQAEEQRNPGRVRSPGRDAALADALRALTVLSETGFGSTPELEGEDVDRLEGTTRELREALGKLQSLRGVG